MPVFFFRQKNGAFAAPIPLYQTHHTWNQGNAAGLCALPPPPGALPLDPSSD